jgi:transcriptional regulator with XRE-family HTH domain
MITQEEYLKKLGIETPTPQQIEVIKNPNNPTVQELITLRDVLKLEKEIKDIQKPTETPNTNIDLFKQLLEYKSDEYKRSLEFLQQINDLKVKIAQLETGGDFIDEPDEMGEMINIFKMFQGLKGQDSFGQSTQFYDIQPSQTPTVRTSPDVPVGLKVEDVHRDMNVPNNPQAQEYLRKIKSGEIGEEQAYNDFNMLRRFGYKLPELTREEFKKEFEKMKSGI